MAIVQTTLTYRSSADGSAPLLAVAAYDDAHTHLPLIVLRGAYMGGDSLLSELQHMAEAGLFALWPYLRGRGGSAGVRDSGGVEILDIYDAINAAVATFGDRIDSSSLNLWGRSGGGGNVYCLVRFPDLFRCAVALYGISDYGYDRHIGWYYSGASARHRDQLNADIGSPELVAGRYMARASVLAAGNNGQTAVHLFCDAEEETCPLPLHTEFVARSHAQGHSNVQLHVSGPGESVRWKHDRSTYSLEDVEPFYLPRILSGSYVQPALPATGSLVVLGYLYTRHFSIWLGDGQDAVADVDYELGPARKHFVFRLRTSDSRVRGRLTMFGWRPREVLLSGQPTYWGFADGVTVIEINPNRAYTLLGEGS